MYACELVREAKLEADTIEAIKEACASSVSYRNPMYFSKV